MLANAFVASAPQVRSASRRGSKKKPHVERARPRNDRQRRFPGPGSFQPACPRGRSAI